jgi:hypothetical protein
MFPRPFHFLGARLQACGKSQIDILSYINLESEILVVLDLKFDIAYNISHINTAGGDATL